MQFEELPRDDAGDIKALEVRFPIQVKLASPR